MSLTPEGLLELAAFCSVQPVIYMVVNASLFSNDVVWVIIDQLFPSAMQFPNQTTYPSPRITH